MTEKENDNLLILVDANDKVTGFRNKLEVHQHGLLHRAFSVFIFNSKGELLLQKRDVSKYHSGGLWTNTCCSHPLKNEELSIAVKRRLKEEMGIDCQTDFQFTFIYKAEVGNGLTEHELDHVFFGYSDEFPKLNLNEASDWKYISKKDLENEIKNNPVNYTAWLKICWSEIEKKWK